MIVFPKRVSGWGIASLLLLLGNVLVGDYGFHVGDFGQKLQIPKYVNYEICVVMQLAAAACGAIAMKRGSKLWVWTVVPATLMAVACFFGEL